MRGNGIKDINGYVGHRLDWCMDNSPVAIIGSKCWYIGNLVVGESERSLLITTVFSAKEEENS